MTLKTRNVLALVICFIALTRILGYVLEDNDLNQVGIASGFAPLPIPFRELNGFENYVLEDKVSLNRKDGGSDDFIIDHKLKKQVDGPHKYQAVSIYLFNWGPKLSFGLIEPVFQHVFCRGYYGMIFGDSITDATITYYSKRTGEKLDRLMYHCHD